MRVVEGEWKYDESDDSDPGELTLADGRKVIEYDGCDWKENPGRLIVKLTKKLTKLGADTHELLEIADGSDTLWYGIVRTVESTENEVLTDAQEQAKSDRRYQIQVATFRQALTTGKRELAQRLVKRWDWERDMVAQELEDWFKTG